MQKYFEKIKEKLEEEHERCINRYGVVGGNPYASEAMRCINIVNQVAEEYSNSEIPNMSEKVTGSNDGWIPVSSGKLPEVEETVYIVAKRKFRDGSFRYIYTSAIYEDGTVREHDSCLAWYEIQGEWDEEEDCQIIPEGWFEDKEYNPEGVINYAVDDEVVAWKPIEPYQPKGE